MSLADDLRVMQWHKRNGTLREYMDGTAPLLTADQLDAPPVGPPHPERNDRGRTAAQLDHDTALPDA